jgi:hypothetical protein
MALRIRIAKGSESPYLSIRQGRPREQAHASQPPQTQPAGAFLLSPFPPAPLPLPGQRTGFIATLPARRLAPSTEPFPWSVCIKCDERLQFVKRLKEEQERRDRIGYREIWCQRGETLMVKCPLLGIRSEGIATL